MRTAYIRPWPATFFYILAAIGFLIYLLMGIGVMAFGDASADQYLYPGLGGVRTAVAFMLIAAGAFVSAFYAAIGYVIEIIAKIEWNTRPQPWATGGMFAASHAASGAKLYYYIDKGPLVGPLSAPDLLNLVRDGKLSIATRYFVEENGQRRSLSNLSEINL
jgi:hypothetical protein